MEYMRRVALAGTELARAQVTTIRLKLLKIGTVILRNTRRIRLLYSSAYPHQQLFATMVPLHGNLLGPAQKELVDTQGRSRASMHTHCAS